MTKMRKGVILGALAVIFGCSIGGIYRFANADSANDFVSSEELQEIYYVGDLFDVPDGQFGDHTARSFVYAPDGTVYTGDEMVLDTYGEYKLVYTATIDGTYYSHEQTFEALTKVNSFSGEHSSAAYGFDEKSGKNGILVGIAEGETYRYNDILNMYETDELNPAISMTFAPSVEGNWDATEVYLSLIDVYDETNKLEIWIRLKDDIRSNVVAKATNQNWGAYYWFGDTYTLNINSSIGTEIYAGNSVHAGSLDYMDVFKNQRLEFWLDEETKQLYVGTRKVFGWNTDFVVLDLDNSEEQTYPWAGFTTGEAYLEITCKNYSSNQANLVLTKLAGNDLTKEIIEDSEGPQIVVESNPFEIDAMPKGLKNAAYPIFTAKAMDKYSGNLSVESRVFFGYERGNGVYDSYGQRYAFEVPVTSSGKFIPTHAGTYAIVYRSADYIGNVTERVVTVQVGEEVYAPLQEVLLEGTTTEIEAGNILQLAKISSYGGGVAPLTVTYKIKLGEEEFAPSGNVYDGYHFVPQKVGTYTVIVLVEDFIGNTCEQKYDVNVVATTKSAFPNSPVLPKYFISDTRYTLPALMAVKDGKEVQTKIKIIDGNGERAYSGEAVFKADENGQARIVYQAADHQIAYTVPVVTAMGNDGLDITKYFDVTQTVFLTADTTGVKINFTDCGEAEFVREVLARNLEFGFNFHSFRQGKFSIYLTDYADSSSSIKVSFVGNGDKIEVLCNDRPINQTISITPNGVVPVKVKYDYAKQTITVGDGIAVFMGETVFGQSFDNFASDKCYLRFVAEEFVGTYAVQVTSIRSQWLNKYVQSDTIAPELYLYENYQSMVYAVGDILTTIPACFADVLDPYVKGTVTVSLDGEVMYTLDGVKMSKLSCAESYQVRLEKQGTYIVSYKVEDGSKKDYTIAYKIQVIDNVAPEIKLAGSIPETIAKGVYTIPAYTATDDSGEVAIEYITLVTPEGKIMVVEVGQVNLSIAGRYLLSYYAMDKNGNTTCKSFYIQVE